MARYNTEAIVLKKINYRDADRIYTFLSKEKGKISAVAKGVRKISSRRSGNLDTLNHVIVNLSESPAGYKTISEVNTINSFKNIKKDLETSLGGYYMAEVVNKALEEDMDSPEIFGILKESLELLESGERKTSFVVNKFEVLLMKALGYEISLEQLRSYGREQLDSKLKDYVKDVLGEDFKSLTI